jgi:hypothetical protein
MFWSAAQAQIAAGRTRTSAALPAAAAARDVITPAPRSCRGSSTGAGTCARVVGAGGRCAGDLEGDRAGLLLPLPSAGLTGLTSASAIVAWAQGRWNLWGRLYYTLVALLGLAFLASLGYWNRPRFRF